jgi:hypothetical protein
MMYKPGIFLRTHLWNEDVALCLENLRAATSHDVLVAADESFAPVATPLGVAKVPHSTKMFQDMDLALLPPDKVMWYNGDYVLYSIAKETDYNPIVLIEYDVLVRVPLDKIVDKMRDDGVDFAAQYFAERGDDWYWTNLARRSYAKELGISSEEEMKRIPIYGCVYPIIFVNRDPVQELLERRRFLSRLAKVDQEYQWIFCEPFTATEIVKLGYNAASIHRYANVQRCVTERPFHLAQVQDAENEIVHPVLRGEAYIKKLFLHLGIYTKDDLKNRHSDVKALLPESEMSTLEVFSQRLK